MPRGQNAARDFCDETIEGAVELMARKGAPIEMILDRLLTYAGAQIVFIEGKEDAIASLHKLAENIEAGAFDAIDAQRAANLN
jgi:hypothetical protein